MIVSDPLTDLQPMASAGRVRVIAFCFLVSLAEGFDIQSIGVAAPKMLPALGLTPSTAGIVFAASLFGMIPGALGGGWLAQRWSRRHVLVVSMIMFGAFTMLTPFVSAYGPLLAVRLLAGLGLGAAMPNLIAVAADHVRPIRHAAMITAMSSGIPLGAALVALIGRLTLASDWHIVFYVGGGLPLVLAIAGIGVLAGDAVPTSHTAQEVGAANPFGQGWRVTAALLCGSYFFTLMALLLLMNWLPLLLAANGIALGAAGLLVLGFNIGGTLGGLLLGRLIARVGALMTVVLVYCGLTGLLIILGTAAVVLPVLATLLFLTGFLLMGGQCVLYGIGAAIYPPTMRVGGVGLAISAGRVGAVVGPIIAGTIIAHGFGSGGVMLATAVIVVAGGGAAFAVTRRDAQAS